MTVITRLLAACASLSSSVFAPQTPKNATMITGIAVQTISSSVLPCVGSPSRRSDGPRWRNFQSE